MLFGSQEYSDDHWEFLNDIIIKDDDESLGIGKRHFIIKYNIETKNYYLRDLGDGSGTFIKIETPLILKPGYIISYGDSHMVVQIFDDEETGGSKI